MYIQIFLSKKKDRAYRAYTQEILKLLQIKCFCRSTYKHKATTLNALRPTTVEKQNCIKALHSGCRELHKTTGLSKIGGGQYDTQCIPYFIDKMLPSYSYCSQLSIIVVYM